MPTDPIITLPTPAPAGGVIVTLESSAPLTVAIAPASVFIPAGSKLPASQPTISAVGIGSATIKAYAPGHLSASHIVNVPAPTMKFSSPTAALAIGESGNVSLTLSGGKAPAAGLQAKLISSEPGKVVVPLSVTFPPGSALVKVPISGVAEGSAQITATSAGVANATTTVSVAPPPKVTVSYGANFLQTINVVFANSSRTAAINLRLISVTDIVAAPPNEIIFPASPLLPTPLGTLPGMQSNTSVFIFAAATGSIAVPFRFTITYEADNMPPQTAVISVPFPRSMDFAGSPLTIKEGGSGTLTLALLGNQAPPTGLTVTLTSSDPKKASVPASVIVPAGGTTVPVAVTGVSGGAVTITAQATVVNFPATATASVNVIAAPSISIPSINVGLGQSVPVALQLSTPAPPGGATVSLTSSDPARVTVSPAALNIPQGASVPPSQPLVTGIGPGTVSIAATASGYQPASAKVGVPTPVLVFSESPEIGVGASATLKLKMKDGQAPTGGLAVKLTASDPTKVSIPPTVSFPAGTSSAEITVNGLAVGSTVITASAFSGVVTANVNVSVTGTLTVPANTLLQLGREAVFAVTIPSPAPAGGVTVSLSSSDAAKVAVSPGTVLIPQGATAPVTQPRITSLGIGSANVNATATGYKPVSGIVSVPAPTLSFSGSPPLQVPFRGTANITLALAGGGVAPRGGLTANLTSSDPAKATVPKSVTFQAGASSVVIPVSGVAVGAATIVAAIAGIGNSSAAVAVVAPVIVATYRGANGGYRAHDIVFRNASNINAINLRITSVAVVSSPQTDAIVYDPAGFAPIPWSAGSVPAGQGIGPLTFGFRATTGTLAVPFRFQFAFEADNMLPQTAVVDVPFPRVLRFTVDSIKVAVGSSSKLVLDLGGPASAKGLTVNLKSSDPARVTVPTTVIFQPGASTAIVGVSGLDAGGASIEASSAGFWPTSIPVTVGGRP